VLVGGTGELCGAIAKVFVEAGAEVVLVGRSVAKAAEKIAEIKGGERCHFEACDASSKEALIDLRARVLSKCGKLDILVNGAGINSPTPFLEISQEELERILTVNFKSVFFACQIFGDYFLERGRGGCVINIGSMSGIIPLSRVFSYSASKAAVHNISRNLAREWGRSGIRVNTLVPGFFPAEQNAKTLSPDRIADIVRHTPMNRMGKADELTGAALLLASDAGAFITGSELVVDGGFSAMTI